MSFELSLIALTIVASVSPLCTWLYLHQLKEWRIDRLGEHLKREGILESLLSRTRVLVGGVWFLSALIVALARSTLLYGVTIITRWSPEAWVMLLLAMLSAMGIVQILFRRQPKPIWTRKAQAIAAISVALDLGIIIFFVTYTTLVYDKPGNATLAQPYQWYVILIPYLQPVIAMIVWLLLLPIDHFLKHRILARAKAIRARLSDLTVIGITGSVGKTTTKELLAHILEDRHPLYTPAYVNSEMGVAQWLIKVLPQIESNRPNPQPPTPNPLIIEMGAYRKGEIALLCEIAKPTIGIVTFVGNQHLALFGSQEKLAEAKGELIESLPREGHAFLNADNNFSASLAGRASCPVTLVGTGGPADVEAFDIEETPGGIKFTAFQTTFTIPLHGTHNVMNVLLAISVAKHLGMSPQAVAEKLRSFQPPKHTFEVREERGIKILDDTHNASSSSFKAAIAWSKSQPYERKTLLTSGLIELGEEHERTHRELGEYAAGVFDRVIFLDSKSAKIFEQGFGKPIELSSKVPASIPPDSLLVCIGRMSQATIKKLFPK